MKIWKGKGSSPLPPMLGRALLSFYGYQRLEVANACELFTTNLFVSNLLKRENHFLESKIRKQIFSFI